MDTSCVMEMPRTARTLTPQTTDHVLARGNHRQAVFHESADYATDRRLFRARLSATPALRCYHDCLMPTHVPLFRYAEHAQPLVTTLQRLQLSYAWYHRRTSRPSGHLGQGRYKSLPILDDPYLLATGRYIERNPLEAKRSGTPDRYPWSSYRHTALGEPDPLLIPSPAYLGLAATPPGRQTAWQPYVAPTRLSQAPSTQQLAGVFQGWS